MKTATTVANLLQQKANWVNCKLLLLLATFFLTSGAFAQTYQDYYVSASAIGSDSNNGKTSTTPFRTIQKAAEEVGPGGIVYIMNGTYNRTTYGEVLNFSRSGTPTAYITFKPFAGHNPIITASGDSYNAVMLLGNYVILDGLEFIGNNANLNLTDATKAFEDTRDGIVGPKAKHNTNCISINAGHHVIIRNCKVHDFPAGGIGVGAADYVTIENNTVYNNSWYTMYATSGISVFGPKAIDNVTTYKIIIRGNVCYNNKTQVPWYSENSKKTGIYKLSDGNGIILDANNGTQNKPIYTGRTLVENNVSYNNGGSGIHGFQAARVDIINNTAYNNGNIVGYAEIFADAAQDVKILNNIMYARNGGNCNSNSNNVIYNHNLYFNGPAYRKGDADVVANPEFVTLALNGTANFRLKNNSPAINTGSNINGQFSTKDVLGIARPIGARPDRGAYEFQGTPVAVNVTPAIQNIYKDALDTEWNDNVSFGGTRNLAYTGNVKEGSKSVLFNYTNSYGGFSLARNNPLSTSNLASFKFWVYSTTARSLKFKTQSDFTSGPSTEVAFTTEANTWKEITITRAQLGNPSIIKRIFFSANNFKGEVIFDDIRFIPITPTIKSNQAITFNPLASKAIGDANFNPAAIASSGLTVSYTSSNSNVATIVNGLVQIVGAGTSVITASQAGNSSYNAATSVSQTLTVTSPVVVTGGLTARYYDNINFTGTVLERVDATVNFNWATTTAPAPGIAAGTYSVLWDGYIKPDYTGIYTFYTTADDGIRIWVNNQLIIDNFVNQSPTEKSGTISLNAGQSYIIQVQYYNDTYSGTAKLSWSHASVLKQIIPQQNLSPAGNGFGLWSTYYNNNDFTGTTLSRIEPTVNFNWTTTSPDRTIENDTFSARWRGQVKPQFTEDYTFYANADDGVRLWVNDVLLIDKWINQSVTEHSGTITLIGGQKYNIVMEYYENTGNAVAQLSWSSASQIKEIIPSTRLYPSTGAIFENATQNVANTTLKNETSFYKSLSLYPNPAKEQLNVQFNSENENEASVELVSMTSIVVSSKSFKANKGANTILVDVSSLEPGIYMLNIKNGVQVAIKKVIVTK